jgi:hypothetical protein
MYQQVFGPVAPTMIQDQYFRGSGLRLGRRFGDERQEKARLVHLLGPETNSFHREMGALGEAYYFYLTGSEWRFFECFFAFPARG